MLIPRGRFRVRLSLRHHSRHARQGFTLVEMLVVAPIIIVVITGLVAAMVAMVGDALTANSRAVTAYDTQDALERIEQDVRTAVNFMDRFSYMTAPQGRDGNTGAFSFTDNKDLILTQQATTGSPCDSSRALARAGASRNCRRCCRPCADKGRARHAGSAVAFRGPPGAVR